MRIGSRRIAVAFATLLVGIVGGTGTAAAATAASTVTPSAGRVCLFDAPHGAWGLGHVAWAYRWADGTDTWDYGATLQNHNWRQHGPEKQMLHDFATLGESGGYRSYRCKDTAADDQSAADKTVTAGFARRYDLIADNCLTRAIEVVKAYDGSGGLDGLDDGRFVFPNAYYNYELPGWEEGMAL